MKEKWRHRLHDAFFEHQTSAGRVLDIFFLTLILASVIVVMMDSVKDLHHAHKHLFRILEWIFTIIFTIEYLMRATLSRKPFKFVFSFLGIVDLIAILPTYASLFISGAQSLLILRVLRLLRIFRIFRLSHFLTDLKFLSVAVKNSFRKIGIFFLFALVMVVLLGSLMYIVEDPKQGVFTSIPQCIYWAIETITTVGYGDLVPITPWGKVVANIVMLIGYAIIAVPTGIITTEMALAIKSREAGHETCKNCNKGGHDHDALHCKHCGAKFEPLSSNPSTQKK